MEQSAIIEALGVQSDFDAMYEIKKRIAFLKSYLVESRQTAYVLGISGGVDSLTAGLLARAPCGSFARKGGMPPSSQFGFPMASKRTNTTPPPRSPPSAPTAS